MEQTIYKKDSIIAWWSGGITSAVACKKAIDIWGGAVKVIMIDTFNEHSDTERFRRDCEKWYGTSIEVISTQSFSSLKEYTSVQATWYKYNSLNTATGAICSTIMKRFVREAWEKENTWEYQVFGFEAETKEFKRSWNLTKNHPKTKSIYPLLMFGLDKKECLNIVSEAGIKIPIMYELGFSNNNCFGTGCVQGGIGYWQKMKRDFPEKYEEMARIEHELTDIKGEPVTMLKDQSNIAKDVVKESGIKWKQFVFLEPHPKYPELKTLSEMKGREPKTLVDCNGFCGVSDGILNKKEREEAEELNFM